MAEQPEAYEFDPPPWENSGYPDSRNTYVGVPFPMPPGGFSGDEEKDFKASVEYWYPSLKDAQGKTWEQDVEAVAERMWQERVRYKKEHYDAFDANAATYAKLAHGGNMHKPASLQSFPSSHGTVVPNAPDPTITDGIIQDLEQDLEEEDPALLGPDLKISTVYIERRNPPLGAQEGPAPAPEVPKRREQPQAGAASDPRKGWSIKAIFKRK